MPSTNDLKSSKFLKKEDVMPPVLATIDGYAEVNVAMESQSPDMKWALEFKELDKPLILNMTNGALIEAIVGSAEFDDWTGQKVVLYNDASVMFAGKLTGGIRVRAPKGQAEPEVAEDEIPF